MTALGISSSLRLKRRASLLEATVILLEGIKMEMEYTQCPLDEIICKYAGVKPYSSINFIKECYHLLENGEDFPTAWSNSVKLSSLYMSQEKEKLLQLGMLLGTSDSTGQVNMLEMYIEYFKQFLQKARKKSDSYSGVSVYIGVFCGFGMFILLI